MNIKLMKDIDIFIGAPICLALITYAKIRKKVDIKKYTYDNINNILIMKFFGMGSILLLSPALREIRKACPDSKIIFFTLSQNKSICESLNIVDEIICLDTSNPLSFLRTTIKN